MVKRTAVLVVCLLALSLTALAESMTPSPTDGNTAGNGNHLTVQSVSDKTNFAESRQVRTGYDAADGRGVGSNRRINSTPECVKVPEPGSLLAFGSVMLLGFRSLKRRLTVA